MIMTHENAIDVWWELCWEKLHKDSPLSLFGKLAKKHGVEIDFVPKKYSLRDSDREGAAKFLEDFATALRG